MPHDAVEVPNLENLPALLELAASKRRSTENGRRLSAMMFWRKFSGALPLTLTCNTSSSDGRVWMVDLNEQEVSDIEAQITRALEAHGLKFEWMDCIGMRSSSKQMSWSIIVRVS